MKEQLIEFETAKLAKEKGFDFVTPIFWRVSESMCVDKNHFGSTEKIQLVNCGNQNETDWTDYPAPTQSLLQKWLRDEHDIDVYIIPNGMRDKNINDRLYHPQLWVKDLYQTELHSKNTYEQALEQGLINALKLIK